MADGFFWCAPFNIMRSVRRWPLPGHLAEGRPLLEMPGRPNAKKGISIPLYSFPPSSVLHANQSQRQQNSSRGMKARRHLESHLRPRRLQVQPGLSQLLHAGFGTDQTRGLCCERMSNIAISPPLAEACSIQLEDLS